MVEIAEYVQTSVYSFPCNETVSEQNKLGTSRVTARPIYNNALHCSDKLAMTIRKQVILSIFQTFLEVLPAVCSHLEYLIKWGQPIHE